MYYGNATFKITHETVGNERAVICIQIAVGNKFLSKVCPLWNPHTIDSLLSDMCPSVCLLVNRTFRVPTRCKFNQILCRSCSGRPLISPLHHIILPSPNISEGMKKEVVHPIYFSKRPTGLTNHRRPTRVKSMTSQSHDFSTRSLTTKLRLRTT